MFGGFGRTNVRSVRAVRRTNVRKVFFYLYVGGGGGRAADHFNTLKY